MMGLARVHCNSTLIGPVLNVHALGEGQGNTALISLSLSM